MVRPERRTKGDLVAAATIALVIAVVAFRRIDSGLKNSHGNVLSFLNRGGGSPERPKATTPTLLKRTGALALQAGAAEVKLRLTGSGALVTTPPLVRTEQQARAGFPVYALVTGPDGEPLRGEAVRVEAVVGQLQHFENLIPTQRLAALQYLFPGQRQDVVGHASSPQELERCSG